MEIVELKDYAEIVIALIATGSLFAAVLQLRLLSKQIITQQIFSKEQAELLNEHVRLLAKQISFQYEWNKKDRALEYSLSKNKNLQQVRRKLDAQFGNIHHNSTVITYKEIIKKLDEDKTLYTLITSLLAHWENMALAIHKGIVDEEVAYEMTAGLVIDYVNVFQNFIILRKEDNNKKAYTYLLALSTRWETKLDGSPSQENESII